MKGQMEMVGLMLLIVIAGFVIVLGLSASLNNVGTNPVDQRFEQAGISSNFVSVLASTDIPECQTDYSAIVKDCAGRFDPNHGLDQGDIDCSGSPSCYYVNRSAWEILNKTMTKWGASYRFTVVKEDIDIVEIQVKGCNESMEKEAPGRHRIPLYPLPGEALIILEVCG